MEEVVWTVSAAVSSLHATTLTAELAQQIKRVRKTGFTIAPEGGTQRMRDVINKNVTEEQLLENVERVLTVLVDKADVKREGMAATSFDVVGAAGSCTRYGR